MWVIMFTTLALWVLIIERFAFFKTEVPKIKKATEEKWKGTGSHMSWEAHRIREMILSQAKSEVFKFIPMIKTLVALCPLLGLLGTVTGMIAVFDVMAVAGTGNARMMASGISMATIPTMAGMVAALSGLYFGSMLEKKAKTVTENLSEQLTFE